VREVIEAAGARLRYLPKYSPDLNPIEQAFSKLKPIFYTLSGGAWDKPLILRGSGVAGAKM
jgi:transposase